MKSIEAILFSVLALAFALLLTGCPSPDDAAPGHPNLTQSKPKAVAAGQAHTLVVRVDGSLWGAGDNTYGQLGVPSATAAQNTPVKVLDGNVVAVAAGDLHTLVLKADGSLWGCGRNLRGQLGDGTTSDRPSLVPILTGVAAVSAGVEHSLALKTDGTLWAWGGNTYQQVGPSATEDPQKTPVQVTGIPGTIVAIQAAGWDSLVLTSDGTLYAWGINHAGQLGYASPNPQPTPTVSATGVSAFAAGRAFTLVLKGATVWGCGENNNGQLAQPLTTTQLSTFTALGPSGVDSIAAAQWTAAAFLKDGTLLTWGLGTEGELGDGTTTNRQPNPVTVAGVPATGTTLVGGARHFLALLSDGILKGWGLTQSGQLGDGVGDGTTVTTQNTPKTLTF